MIVLYIVLIIGIFSVVVIFIRNLIRKAKNSFSIEKAKGGKLNISKLREKLDMFIGKPIVLKRQLNDMELEKAINGAYSIPMKKNKIIHVQKISENEFLFFTENTFSDFVTMTVGIKADVKKVFSTTYLLNYNREKNEVTIKSDLYANSDSKFIRDDFKAELSIYFWEI
ncbi:MAG: hypothetical protein IAF38_14185 [Bacteroidia bacterium]|nr:hypothetical protein [Bacteroidia bacterium]